ncbi:MAG: PAS domain S-box protein [Holophaga sp.]|nr:PAS domain S-box protein [Holophaga sp.]
MEKLRKHFDSAEGQVADGVPFVHSVPSAISEHQHVEEELREAKESLANFFEHAVLGMYRSSIDGQPLMLNPALCKMAGYASFEAVVQEYQQRPKEDLEINPTYSRERFRREINENGHVVGLESPWTKPNGEVVMLRECAWVVRDAAGAPKYYEGIFEDITERKRMEKALLESQQQYEDLAATIRVGTYILRSKSDGARAFEYVSPRMATILGSSPESLLQDVQSVNRIIHPEDLDSFLVANQQSFQQHGPFNWHGRAIVAGTLRWLHFESTPKLLPDGEILWHGFVVDITEGKILEAEKAALLAQNHQLKKSESLGRMASSIAHHFNNKLQAVLGNLELINALPKGADPARFLAMAKKGAEKAAEVSRSMLIYLGQTTLKREPCRLADCCKDALPLLQQALPSSLTLEMNFPTQSPIVEANAEQLQQLLTNLLSNAGEAMEDRQGTVRLTLRACSANEIATAHRFPYAWQPDQPSYACLEVADSGGGMAEADLDKIFDPFFSTKFVGRGLGLAVVLGIVQAHGGAITVTSRLGHGSAFRVYFPVVVEAVSDLPENNHSELQPEAAVSGGTLMLIDDDPMVLESTKVMVEMLGFNVLTALDGVAALQVFRQHQAAIRLVITDLTMPRLDGWSTLAALRQLEPNLPVILASGHDKAHALEGAHAEQPQAFLSKPYGIEQLREALRQVIVGE